MKQSLYIDGISRVECLIMDYRYATALRNATGAWSRNRTVDMLTMQELRRPLRIEEAETLAVTPTGVAQMEIIQPELARYGNVGTRLNLFA